MAYTLEDAAALLTAYPAQRLSSFSTLIAKRSRVKAESDALNALVATQASGAAINAKLQDLDAERAALASAVEAMRSLNLSRVAAQAVVNTSLNITPSVTPLANPLVGPSGPAGPVGPVGEVGPTGPAVTPVGGTNAVQIRSGAGVSLAGVTPPVTTNDVLCTNGSSAPSFRTLAGSLMPLMSGMGVPSTSAGVDLTVIGDNPIVTVPAGKRYLMTGLTVVNASGSTIAAYLTVRVGAVTSRLLTISASIASGTNVNAYQFPTLFEEGDIVGVNVTVAATGVYVRLRGVLFDATAPLRVARKLDTWINGNNTVYTVPAGRSAMVVTTVPWMQDTATFRIVYHNTSGANTAVRVCAVPSGQTIAVKHSIGTTTNTSTVATNASLSVGAGGLTLSAGDSVVVTTNSASASQAFTMAYVEFS